MTEDPTRAILYVGLLAIIIMVLIALEKRGKQEVRFTSPEFPKGRTTGIILKGKAKRALRLKKGVKFRDVFRRRR